MNIREISKPVTAKGLNESLAKRFGQKINIDAFTLEQLQDVRNRIRTKLSQVEMNENFDSVIKNEGYQKSKLFLDVLNAAIAERENISEAAGCPCNEPPGGKCTCPASCKDCDCKTNESKKAKPDYLDFDGDGNKEEPMKKALKDKKKKKVGESQVDELGVTDRATGQTQTLPSFDAGGTSSQSEQQQIIARYQKAKAENDRASELLLGQLIKDLYGDNALRQADAQSRSAQQANQIGTRANAGNAQPTGTAGAMAGESIVREGAEDEAELVMAAKDMVDRVTGWMEDTAEMQTESMLELADAIRDEMGSEKSEQFVGSIKPALESLYAAMEQARTTLTSGVGMLTGEEDPMAMGAEPAGDVATDDLGLGPDEAAAADNPMEPVDDDGMGAAPAAAGGEEEAGRAKRESVQRSKKKLAERSRRIGTLLSKKKS